MCAYINEKCLYNVSISAVREPGSCQEKCDWINYCDGAYGTMCIFICPTMHYLLDFVEYPFKLWRNIDEALSMYKEDMSYKDKLFEMKKK